MAWRGVVWCGVAWRGGAGKGWRRRCCVTWEGEGMEMEMGGRYVDWIRGDDDRGGI